MYHALCSCFLSALGGVGAGGTETCNRTLILQETGHGKDEKSMSVQELMFEKERLEDLIAEREVENKEQAPASAS